MKFFKEFSTFHKYLFSIYATLNIVIFLIPLFYPGGIAKNLTIIGVLALISTLTGLLSSIYTARGQAVAYIWGVFNTATYIFVAWASHAYGQSILYIFFETPLQLIGYYLWSKNTKNSSSNTVESRRLDKRGWIILIVSFFTIWILYAIFISDLPYLLKTFTHITIAADKEFIIDSLSSTLTIIAVILTSKRFYEQWHFWIASASMGIILFLVSMLRSRTFSLNSFSALTLWSLFLISSIYGLNLWKKLNSDSNNKEELAKFDKEEFLIK
ncbi:nicotinamide riboside transporter PnuC [uncultured Clostridium sp.]|uniref:nicotinamide riboside transporter PnuC n=1 Tax=uncultured Clostridium sp. TaxID=59620 RepID=UPI00261B2224|nr:nicotinamide riboside transporter PnuC [uncultured Clostridium sp.]